VRKEMSPAIVGVVIVVILVVAGFFLWKGTGGAGKPAGAVGEAGPFERGRVGNAAARPPQATPGPPGGIRVPGGGGTPR
jgi:hypothetical protein